MIIIMSDTKNRCSPTTIVSAGITASMGWLMFVFSLIIIAILGILQGLNLLFIEPKWFQLFLILLGTGAFVIGIGIVIAGNCIKKEIEVDEF